MASMKFLLLLPKHGLVGYLLFFNDTVVKKIISIGLLSFGTGIVIAKDIEYGCSGGFDEYSAVRKYFKGV